MNKEIFLNIENILRGRTGKNLEIGLITAENEMGKELPDTVNNRRNEQLYKELNSVTGANVYRIQGNLGGINENSFLTTGVSLRELKKLAAKYRQQAFIYGTGKDDNMLFNYMEVKDNNSDELDYESIQNRKTFIYKPHAKENFSSYKGVKFIIPFFDNHYNGLSWEDLSKEDRDENSNNDLEESKIKKLKKLIGNDSFISIDVDLDNRDNSESYIKRISKIVESLKIEEEKVKIKVKHGDLLEVPEGKKFWNLPLSHYKKLVDKKGYTKVIRALNNLKVWNREDDPDISDKADKIMDKLKKEYKSE